MGLARYYSLAPRRNRKKKIWKGIGYAAAALAVFAIAFFISYRLVASTQTGVVEIESLKSEIRDLKAEVTARDEKIQSLELQLQNVSGQQDQGQEKKDAQPSQPENTGRTTSANRQTGSTSAGQAPRQTEPQQPVREETQTPVQQQQPEQPLVQEPPAQQQPSDQTPAGTAHTQQPVDSGEEDAPKDVQQTPGPDAEGMQDAGRVIE